VAAGVTAWVPAFAAMTAFSRGDSFERWRRGDQVASVGTLEAPSRAPRTTRDDSPRRASFDLCMEQHRGPFICDGSFATCR